MASCNWCGTQFNTGSGTSAGWGLKTRLYCCNRCKTQGEEAREKSQGSSNNSGGFFSSLFNSDDKEDGGQSNADGENDKFEF